MAKDRHRPGYYKEYAKRTGRKDRHRKGYYHDYNAAHPERLERGFTKGYANGNFSEGKTQSSSARSIRSRHLPSMDHNTEGITEACLFSTNTDRKRLARKFEEKYINSGKTWTEMTYQEQQEYYRLKDAWDEDLSVNPFQVEDEEFF